MALSAKELMVGIDLQKEFAQLTYYQKEIREPVTFGQSPGKQALPMALRLDAGGTWQFAEEKKPDDLYFLPDLYEILDKNKTVQTPAGTFSPVQLLSVYLSQCLDLLRMFRSDDTQIHLMVTVRKLTEEWSNRIVGAWEALGRERKYLYLQDHLASFYYYTLNQKKKNWNQDTALLEYEEDTIYGYVLHIDTTVRPSAAAVRLVASQKIDESLRGDRSDAEWDKEKDRLFFELLKKVFERRNVAVSYLTGDFFQKSWAERSIQYLCYRRQAFQGQNLYSRGACFAAMERAGLVAERNILFYGEDMVQVNLGMEMRIRGKESYYPLVSAGVNWYEAWHVCEFIPDQESEIRIVSTMRGEEESVTHLLPFRNLGDRPNRTLRIRMTVYFTARNCCRIEAEDLGFGELVPSRGQRWVRSIHF